MKVSRTVRSGGKGGKWSQSSTQTLPIAIADPDNGIFQVPELNAMVQEVNETQVERQEQLSDKVQFCDKKTAVMENAERREARLEKEKAAEKAEVKGGIHGRLEKAKAEIKAKEADKVPKNKSKDLAAAL